MTSELIVHCNNLTKDYGSGNGLFDCNLKINQGEVFGLIGPNGAGKSTLIKLLMDLIRPTSGSVMIFDLDSQRDSIELKKFIGYLPGDLMQFQSVTAGYILNFLMKLRKVDDHKRINELAERLQLDLSRKFQELSHGNRQKVGLIQAFMHKPKLMILDEPTLGLDPLIQRELRGMIKESVDMGSTVILSSHVLSEVESYCSRIGLINKGRIVRDGTLAELRSSRVHKLKVQFKNEIPSKLEIERFGGSEITTENSSLSFEVKGEIDQIIKALAKYQVLEIDSRELSLEEVFFSEVKD